MQVHSSSLTFSDETKTRREKRRHRSLSNRFFHSLISMFSYFKLHIGFKITWIKIHFQISNYIAAFVILIFEPDSFTGEISYKTRLFKNGSDITLTSNLETLLKVIASPFGLNILWVGLNQQQMTEDEFYIYIS